MTRTLVFTGTADFRHDSIPASVAALRAAPGLDVVATEDPADLADLTGFEVVAFVSTSGDVLDDRARASLRAFVEGGGGFVGVHCAAVTEASWDFYGALLGARFAGHPDRVQPGVAVVVDADHPSTAHLPERWPLEDEWYSFAEVRDDLRLLVAVEEGSFDPETYAMPAPHPQAWCREVGGGRSWFTALGHAAELWSDDAFLRHVLGGIAWAARAA